MRPFGKESSATVADSVSMLLLEPRFAFPPLLPATAEGLVELDDGKEFAAADLREV